MGNRAYLSGDNNALLFEANNALPGLWLALLDDQTIDDALPALRAAWEAQVAEGDGLLDVALPSAAEADPVIALPTSLALANLNRRLPAVVRTHPELSGLFSDFASHLASFGGDRLCLDLLAIAHFTEFEPFIASVRAEVAALDGEQIDELSYLDPHDPIGGGVGFAAWSDSTFAETSEHYQRWLVDRGHSAPVRPSSPGTATRGSVIGWGVALCLCPFFTWLAVVGHRNEGFGSTVVLLGTANLVFYVTLGWGFWGEWSKFHSDG